jgi:hypothetical protein
LDAAYDSPSKFEQIYYLNNSFTFAKDAVIFHTNIFGVNSDPLLDTHAELFRIRGRTQNISINDLNGKYLQFSPATVRPGETAITIAALPGERSLQTALQKMVELGYVRFTSATREMGAVYSFDLELEVFRGPYSLGTFIETFHFRADAVIERSTFWLVVLLTGLAILFISDFTYPVLDYRWRQYFKAMAGTLTEVLHYLTYAIKVAQKFPDVPAMINDDLVALLKDIIKQLEKFIAKFDDKEAKALREEALELLKKVTEHKAPSVKMEAELTEWKNALENIIARTEQIQQRTLHLSKRRFRLFDVPLTRQSLHQAISQANQTVFSGFERLKTTIGEINLRRKDKQKLHEKTKEQRIGEIARLLDDYLDGQAIKQAMEKLGEPFPLNVDPEDLFKLRPIYTRGEFEYINGEQRLVYPNFFFAVKTSETRDDDPIWFMIRKAGEDYVVAQADTDSKRNITSGTVTLPALNPQDNEVEVRYTIKVTPEKAAASKRTRDFKITPSDVKLITPDPTPEPWFEEVPTPEEPKEVKLK